MNKLIGGLMVAYLIFLYGRRFLAVQFPGSPVSPIQEAFDSQGNRTFYRNSNDFGWWFLLFLIYGLWSFAFFLLTTGATMFLGSHSHNRLIEFQLQIEQYFIQVGWIGLFFSTGWFLSLPCGYNLSKAMFHPNETLSQTWETLRNYDYVEWQLAAQVTIMPMFLIVIYAIPYAHRFYGKPIEFAHEEQPVMNPAADFFRYVYCILWGNWMGLFFIPFLADLMFPEFNIYVYSEYSTRTRFQLQTAYMLVSTLLLSLMCYMGWWLVTIRHGIPWYTFFYDCFPLLQGMIWGIQVAYGFLIGSTQSDPTPLYPTNYSGECFAAMLLVSFGMFLVEAGMHCLQKHGHLRTTSGEPILERTGFGFILMVPLFLYPCIFAIAYPVAFLYTTDYPYSLGRQLGMFPSWYPARSDLTTLIWVQFAHMVSYQVIIFMDFVATVALLGFLYRKHSSKEYKI